MKRLLLSLIIIISLVSTANAQKRLGWGIKVGLTISSLKGYDVEDMLSTSYKGDLVLGAFLDYRTFKWLSFGTELLYSGQGSKFEGEELYADLSYLILPVLANFHITKGLTIKSGIQVGYAFSFRFRSRNETIEPDRFETIKVWNYSVPIGMSYTLKSGFIFDARYTFDISSIDQESFLRNSVFTFTVGLRL